ncbi:hypothetical protein ADZ36_19175 [Streptomyces fradiae]|uniref:Uncharacterized protein n=1 Tax=Streptomyces fradiae TaxID=1906 RepID=A0ACC4W8K8_STRFR|nr:hypothetical protein ADZ36_19175 [Streptomyces fradiae]
MCTIPVGMRRASSRPRAASRVTMPSARPYAEAAARAAASSSSLKERTGATGPKTSSSYAGVSPASARTVGR